MNKIYCALFGMFLASLPLEAKVVVYPRIEDEAVKDDGRYEVYVRSAAEGGEWQALQVFSVEVDMDTRSRAAMAQFDMDEPVDVKVVAAGSRWTT